MHFLEVQHQGSCFKDNMVAVTTIAQPATSNASVLPKACTFAVVDGYQLHDRIQASIFSMVLTGAAAGSTSLAWVAAENLVLQVQYGPGARKIYIARGPALWTFVQQVS